MTASPMPADPLAAAQAELDTVGDAPLDDRAEIFDRIHRTLAEALQATAPDHDGA